MPVEQDSGIIGKRWLGRLNFVQILELILGRLKPFGIGFAGRKRRLDFLILNDAALLKVNQQHLAGLKPPFAQDILFFDRQNTRFRRHDDIVIIGHAKACRAQSVAVECRANLAAIGKGNRRRAVPWLHQRGMIFVKSLAPGIHQRIARPGFRDQHHHGLRERIAACEQQFERIVEAGRIRLAVRNERPHLVKVRPDQVRFHRPSARIHPVHIAAHRVDLAIMRDEPVGMGQLPRRKGVG